MGDDGKRMKYLLFCFVLATESRRSIVTRLHVLITTFVLVHYLFLVFIPTTPTNTTSPRFPLWVLCTFPCSP